MCAQLDIEISFCTKYYPPSKGKIEKHYGTIKSAFYKEAEHAGLSTLDDLNQFFFAWLTKEYHHAKHSELGMTPIERWRQDEHSISRVSPEAIRHALMLRTQRTVNKRTAIIRLDNRSYQASPELAGRSVEVRWQARTQDHVEVWYNGKLIETAPHTTALPDIDFTRKPERKQKLRGITYESSKRYRQSLLAEHQSEKPISHEPVDDYLAQDEFIQLVTTTLDKALEPEEIQFLSAFFLDNSPLRSRLIQSLLNQIVNAKGKQLHLRSYLDHIRTSTLNSRR